MRSELKNKIKDNYTIIPNELITDPSLNPTAKCLYALLASKPDEWRFYNNALANEMGCTTDTLRKHLKILEDSGWIEIIKQSELPREKGRFPPNKYILKHIKSTVSEKFGIGKNTHRKNHDTYKEVPKVRSNNSKKESILLSESEKTGFSSPNTEQVRGSSNFNKEGLPPVKERTKSFLPFADQLASIIRTKKRVKIPPTRLHSWATEFRKLVEVEGVDRERVQRVLDWYGGSIGGQYVPVVESGASFRHKFLRLEVAMEREQGQGGHREENKPSTTASLSEILDRLGKPKTYSRRAFPKECLAPAREILGNGVRRVEVAEQLVRMIEEIGERQKGIEEKVYELLPSPFSLVCQYVRWLGGQEWVEHPTLQMFSIHHTLFQHFCKRQAKNNLDLHPVTGEKVRR